MTMGLKDTYAFMEDVNNKLNFYFSYFVENIRFQDRTSLGKQLSFIHSKISYLCKFIVILVFDIFRLKQLTQTSWIRALKK